MLRGEMAVKDMEYQEQAFLQICLSATVNWDGMGPLATWPEMDIHGAFVRSHPQATNEQQCQGIDLC